jgi:hypothetical protein
MVAIFALSLKEDHRKFQTGDLTSNPPPQKEDADDKFNCCGS